MESNVTEARPSVVVKENTKPIAKTVDVSGKVKLPDPVAMFKELQAKEEAGEGSQETDTGVSDGEATQATEGEEKPAEPAVVKDRAYFLKKKEEHTQARKAQEEFKAKESAFKEKEEEYNAFQEVLAGGKENPIAAIKAMGWDPIELLKAIQEGKFDAHFGAPPSNEQVISSEIKKEMDAYKKAERDRLDTIQKQQYESNVAAAKVDVKQLIHSSETYPICKAQELEDTVFETWVGMVEQEKDIQKRRLITFQTAAQKVEEYETARIKKLYPLLAKVKETEATESEKKQKSDKNSNKQSPKSLSNKAVASASELKEEKPIYKNKDDYLNQIMKKHLK